MLQKKKFTNYKSKASLAYIYKHFKKIKNLASHLLNEGCGRRENKICLNKFDGESWTSNQKRCVSWAVQQSTRLTHHICTISQPCSSLFALLSMSTRQIGQRLFVGSHWSTHSLWNKCMHGRRLIDWNIFINSS